MNKDDFKACMRIGWKVRFDILNLLIKKSSFITTSFRAENRNLFQTMDYFRYAFRMVIFMIRGFSLRKL